MLAALNANGRALAVAAASNPVAVSAARTGHLLACPVTVLTPAMIPSFATRFFSDRRQLRDRLKEQGSLVHITMGSPWDALYLKAAHDAGLKTVVTVHDATRHPGEENRLLEAAEHFVLSRADHVVTMSRHVFDEFRKSRNYALPVHLVEGGLLTQSEPQLAPRIFPKDRPLRILFLGRIHPYKGLDLLLAALCLLQEQGHDFELMITGSGDLGPYQSGLAQIRRLSVKNDWLSDEDVRAAMARADVMALTYVEASQSGVALDAQWAALPSIATPVGALPRQLTHGIDSIIAEETTPASVANGLATLLRDPALYGALSDGAHAAYQRVGLRPVADKWRALYSEILKGVR